MSLLLLFLPHDSTPVNPVGAFTPGVISAIEIIRPSLVSMEVPTGAFTESTVTYSSSTVTYSSSTELYGGSDLVRIKITGLDSIDQLTPTIYSIDKF
jgi:hypothetical protein